MDRLLTIDDVARLTGLEESLIRFYESEYSQTLPAKILKGDALYFPSSAVEALRQVHLCHGTGGQKAPPQPATGFGRVIAVTSGKGGVGKSNIALNLAVEFQRLGKMSVVVDADLGMANVHLLAGITPAVDLGAFLASDRSLSDVICPGPEGIGIIPGCGGVLSLADCSRRDRMRLVEALATVEAASDIVLVDTGGGMGSQVRDFLRAAGEILFVLTPDLTSLADAYGLLKGLHQEDPATANLPVYSVINMAESLRQAADTALRFSACAEKFLGREVRNVGYVLKDAAVGAAMARRQPYAVFRPDGRASRSLRNVAHALEREAGEEARTSSAFGRYLKLLEAARLETLGGHIA